MVEKQQYLYSIKESAYSSHSAIKRFANKTDQSSIARLLDVGCAQGDLAIQFLELGYDVTGIEPHPSWAQEARRKGLNVIEGSLEDSNLQLVGPFDVIILGDVLEHLENPSRALQSLLAVTNQGSQIIISVPNVAHFSVRMMLSVGIWDYTDRGILDRTHLRFFTKKTIFKLCKENGLSIENWTVTPTPLERLFPTLAKAKWFNSIHALNYAIAKLAPTLLGYQLVIKATIATEQE